ncbi:hypothetical protein RB25_03330 [Herbaspirillum rubrisubalbicans]|uniref:Uncharacterized protein n=1 Tax=Herbaspirillum rubrisubalbicans TaxID=80842 RepID=A0ABX9C2E0_9BURK|nr:hypothetical protein [Herbaspirillum rubrisubalbicans]RAM64656.1 hypothetical protein RB24_10690 [Herbaspirillum rubrisubalbicans]RAN49896.1 hypothetical protein RB25_03330 [Herbaspirillum rubrisubalbicans]
MNWKQKFSHFLAGFLFTWVLILAIVSHQQKEEKEQGEKKDQQGQKELNASAPSIKFHLKGLIGAEKLAFFNDPAVIAALAQHGFAVHAHEIGPRDAASHDLHGYDFAFPFGATSAEVLQARSRTQGSYQPFFSQLAIVSWRELLPALERAKVVEKQPDGDWYRLDTNKLLSMSVRGQRWNDLPGKPTFQQAKPVRISLGDLRSSNASQMYLALAAHVVDHDPYLGNNPPKKSTLSILSPHVPSHDGQWTAVPSSIAQFKSLGMEQVQLMAIDESDFLAYQTRRKESDPEIVLLYPYPSLLNQHVLLPFNDQARRLGELLSTDPQLQKLAVAHGYRDAASDLFSTLRTTHKLAAPSGTASYIDPPRHATLEKLIQSIESTSR